MTFQSLNGQPLHVPTGYQHTATAPRIYLYYLCSQLRNEWGFLKNLLVCALSSQKIALIVHCVAAALLQTALAVIQCHRRNRPILHPLSSSRAWLPPWRAARPTPTCPIYLHAHGSLPQQRRSTLPHRQLPPPSPTPAVKGPLPSTNELAIKKALLKVAA